MNLRREARMIVFLFRPVLRGAGLFYEDCGNIRPCKTRMRELFSPNCSRRQFVGERAQVRPAGPLLARLPQQVSRMEHRQRPQLAAVVEPVGEPFAPRSGDPLPRPKESLGGRRAHADKNLGSSEFNLPPNEREARLGLLRRRRPIAWWPPRDHVRDIDLRSIQSDRSQHAVEKLPRPADEWAPDPILVRAG